MAHTIQRSTIIITIHTYTQGLPDIQKENGSRCRAAFARIQRGRERENERQDGNREIGRRLWAAIRNLCSKKGVIFIGNSFVNVCVLV